MVGRPVDAAINSHWHSAHIWGKQAFGADTDIIGGEETRRTTIATNGHGAYDQFMVNAEANLLKHGPDLGLLARVGSRLRGYFRRQSESFLT